MWSMGEQSFNENWRQMKPIGVPPCIIKTPLIHFEK